MQIKQRTFTLVYAFDICLPSHLTFALEYMDGLGPSQQTQKFGSAKAFFLGLRCQSRLLPHFYISAFAMSPQRQKESYPNLKESKCCTVPILFQGGNMDFSFNCLFSSPYKIKLISSE